jgi:hypothetical protein
MIRGRTGRYETTSTGGEIVKAFIPARAEAWRGVVAQVVVATSK